MKHDAVIPTVLYTLVTAIMRTVASDKILDTFGAIGHDNIQIYFHRGIKIRQSPKYSNVINLRRILPR